MTRFISYSRASLRLWRKQWVGVLVAHLGLSIAFSVSLLAAFYLYDGYRSDSWLPDVERIYRVATQNTQDGKKSVFGYSAMAPHKLQPQLADKFSELEASARLLSVSLQILKDGKETDSEWIFADPSFAEIFHLPMLAGSVEAAFLTPGKIILSEKAAMPYGGAAAVGQQITVRLGEKDQIFVVVGVMRALPNNTHLMFEAVGRLEQNLVPSEPWNQARPNVLTYLKLRPGTNRKLFEASFRAFAKTAVPIITSGNEMDMLLEPVPGLQYHTEANNWGAMRPSLDKDFMTGLAVVAMVLLAAASFNYVNVFTAINMLRSKEFTLRRLAGADRRHMLVVAGIEGVLIAALTYGLALLLAADISGFVSEFTSVETPLFGRGRVSLHGLAFLFAFAVCVLGNLIPLTMVMGKSVVSSLNESQGSITGSRGRMRQVLVGVQTLLFVAVLLAAGQISRQVDYLLSMDRGFDAKGLAFVEAPNFADEAEQNANKKGTQLTGPSPGSFAEVFRGEVMKIGGVNATAITGFRPFNASLYYRRLLQADGSYITAMGIFSGPDYLDLVGAKYLARLDGDWGQITNPVAMEIQYLPQFGLASADAALGHILAEKNRSFDGTDRSNAYTIVAVLPDLKDHQFPAQTIMYELSEHAFPGNPLAINFDSARRGEVRQAIEQLWTKHYPDQDFEMSFTDETLEQHYKDDINSGKAVVLIAGLSAVLGFAGLFGMASHWLKTRERELALRRVFGAPRQQVMQLALRRMLVPVLIGAVAALVPSWLIMQQWLESFTDRVPLGPLHYGGAIVGTLLFAGFLIWFQVRTALKKRPARVLYHE